MTPQEALSQTLEAEMAARKIAKHSLASRIGLGRRTLYGRLAGEKSWTISELEQAASYMGIPFWDLLAEAEARQQKEKTAESSQR